MASDALRLSGIDRRLRIRAAEHILTRRHGFDVRGHEKVPGYGQLKSPLVATKSPRFWPREVPTPSLNIHQRGPLAGDGGGANQTAAPTKGRLNEISEGAHGHACRLSRGGELSGRCRDLGADPRDGETTGAS